MKKILFLLAVLFSIQSFSQETKYKEYSYSELFKMIENEKDTVFKLSDALIKYIPETDSLYASILNGPLNIFTPLRKDSITINKKLIFNNVQFLAYYSNDVYNPNGQKNLLPKYYASGFVNMIFNKPVIFNNTLALFINHCDFKESVILNNGENSEKISEYFKNNLDHILHQDLAYQDIIVRNSKFNSNTRFDYALFRLKTPLQRTYFEFRNNIFKGENVYIRSINTSGIFININQFKTNFRPKIVVEKTIKSEFIKNTFDNDVTLILKPISETGSVNILENTFSNNIILDYMNFPAQTKINWNQWKNKIIISTAKSYYLDNNSIEGSPPKIEYQKYAKWARSKEVNISYKEQGRIQNNQSYLEEIKFRYEFYNFFKSIYDIENANIVYVEIKDLETKRSEYLHTQNPSFKTFFKWRINQFLKVFSAYGTEPERAVVFSMYVILLFAFIYLLFPNSWDAHGRKRIMNRYAFFFKYMNKKSGIHEVYLDNQKEDLLEFDEFKTLVAQQGKTVPKFFTATALPLYKWAISGTKLSAGILKRVDIMKGTWSDLPKSKRIWKSILLIGAFSIAVIYDILIKMLNALMLSINTFTTLGFGEIPIKGLPRYLAIIQGFIGWFMLTIFSVSLISQLLN
jgi:hypothetical protein